MQKIHAAFVPSRHGQGTREATVRSVTSARIHPVHKQRSELQPSPTRSLAGTRCAVKMPRTALQATPACFSAAREGFAPHSNSGPSAVYRPPECAGEARDLASQSRVDPPLFARDIATGGGAYIACALVLAELQAAAPGGASPSIIHYFETAASDNEGS